ncbi:MAG: DNA-directed RNA polymerase subunit omega [Oscillospiraceae bacterium]|jgi:DNA-directed RNA polymerase subunit K/omega|nr:DNA-directed RNA polymerase subunit omega [Oscillospiraceae bacterium]
MKNNKSKVLPSVEDMISGRACRFALAIAVSKRARGIILDFETRGKPLETNAVNLAFHDFETKNFVIEN